MQQYPGELGDVAHVKQSLLPLSRKHNAKERWQFSARTRLQQHGPTNLAQALVARDGQHGRRRHVRRAALDGRVDCRAQRMALRRSITL